MTYGGDPFGSHMGDPFGGADAGPPISFGAPVGSVAPGYGAAVPGFTPGVPGYTPGFGPGMPPAPAKLNTFAVLAPIFGVLLPPGGIVFGHLALPQIKRTGERGRASAIAGLILGYLLTVALIIGLIAWLLLGDDDGTSTQISSTTVTTSKAGVTVAPSTKTVTATSQAPERRRDKIELSQATVGMCVEIQSRDTGNDALDLFQVDCEQRDGVYTVTSIASSSSACNTTYAAAPPDHSFAVCLNKY